MFYIDVSLFRLSIASISFQLDSEQNLGVNFEFNFRFCFEFYLDNSI